MNCRGGCRLAMDREVVPLAAMGARPRSGELRPWVNLRHGEALGWRPKGWCLRSREGGLVPLTRRGRHGRQGGRARAPWDLGAERARAKLPWMGSREEWRRGSSLRLGRERGWSDGALRSEERGSRRPAPWREKGSCSLGHHGEQIVQHIGGGGGSAAVAEGHRRGRLLRVRAPRRPRTSAWRGALKPGGGGRLLEALAARKHGRRAEAAVMAWPRSATTALDQRSAPAAGASAPLATATGAHAWRPDLGAPLQRGRGPCV